MASRNITAIASAPSAAAIDRLVADLDRLRARSPDDPPILSMLARALVWRGERHQHDGDMARARADWTRVRDLLAGRVSATRDRNLLEAWVRTQVHLGARAQAAPQIAWLQRAGYRHPGFVAFYEAAPQHP